MFLKRKKRFERLREASEEKPKVRMVSDSELFKRMGYQPEVIN